MQIRIHIFIRNQIINFKPIKIDALNNCTGIQYTCILDHLKHVENKVVMFVLLTCVIQERERRIRNLFIWQKH